MRFSRARKSLLGVDNCGLCLAFLFEDLWEIAWRFVFMKNGKGFFVILGWKWSF
jgi:hypothetical protein